MSTQKLPMSIPCIEGRAVVKITKAIITVGQAPAPTTLMRSRVLTHFTAKGHLPDSAYEKPLVFVSLSPGVVFVYSPETPANGVKIHPDHYDALVEAAALESYPDFSDLHIELTYSVIIEAKREVFSVAQAARNAKRLPAPVCDILSAEREQAAKQFDLFTITHDRDWTWVSFKGHPPFQVGEALRRQFGAYYSRKKEAYYVKERLETVSLAAFIQNAIDSLVETVSTN